MAKFAIFFLTAAALFAAEDSWSKVKELRSGTDIRIYKNGAGKPVEGKLDEARDDAIVVVLKKEQVAIAKEQIDRLDARSSKSGGRTTTESKAGTDANPNTMPPAGMGHGAPVPGSSYSTTTTIGSKPDYETVYRRPGSQPAKK
jgi:hypothetical protein